MVSTNLYTNRMLPHPRIFLQIRLPVHSYICFLFFSANTLGTLRISFFLEPATLFSSSANMLLSHRVCTLQLLPFKEFETCGDSLYVTQIPLAHLFSHLGIATKGAFAEFASVLNNISFHHGIYPTIIKFYAYMHRFPS